MASIQKQTAGSGIAVEGLNDVIFGLRGMDGSAVPKRTLGSRGFVGGGTDKSAFLDIRKTNKFARNLEFGRKYQFIPNLIVGRAKEGPSNTLSKTQRGAVGRAVQPGVKLNNRGIKGSYYPASKMKRRVYKEWVGDFWDRQGGFPEGTKFGGYVAEKTIAKITPGLSESYSDEMLGIVKKAIKGK